MPWLFIDTHERGVSRWGWMDTTGVELRTILGSAGQLLNAFAKERKRLSSARGVCVVAGPGSFSSVRTGVLYANLLSRLFRIPLVGVTLEEAKDLDALSGRLLDTRYAIRDTRYVAPLYDAEPNITIPRT